MILKGGFHLSKNFHGQERNRTEKKSFSAFTFEILCHVAGQNLGYSNYMPSGIYLLKVNNKNARTRYEICSKLKTKTPERR